MAAVPGTWAAYIADIFQLCWVTTDMDRAVEVMSKRFGAEKWEVYSPAPLEEVMINGKPGAPVCSLALAMTGDMMLELIEPKEGADYYAQVLRKDRDFDLRFHHVGVLSGTTQQSFDEAVASITKKDGPPEVHGTFGPAANWAYWNYLDELGHYLELVQFSDEGRKLVESLKA